MNTVLLIISFFVLLIIFVVLLIKNSQRKIELRKLKWQEEESNCQIEEIPESKYETWRYKGNGKDLFVEVTWADMKSGFRIFMNGFSDGSTTVPIEENKIVAACTLKYFGFVREANTLKLHHEGFAHPSDELIKQIEDKIKPLGFVRINQDESKEITWSKK